MDQTQRAMAVGLFLVLVLTLVAAVVPRRRGHP